jgi:hypothetical protein
MSARSGSRWAIGVGIGTLVTIAVTVLLTTFSVLALVTAHADLRLSNKVIESTQEYYVADGQAERWLAQLDDFVAREHVDLVGALSAEGYTTSPDDDGGVLITQTFSINTNKEIIVEVIIDKDGGLAVVKWQTNAKR